MMARQSQSWKGLEKAIAKALNGTRVLRGSDFSRKDVDVIVPDFPMLRIDAKYRKKWAHHRFLDEVGEKYCVDPEDVPILVTKHLRQTGAIVSLTLEHFAAFLHAIRDLRKKA